MEDSTQSILVTLRGKFPIDVVKAFCRVISFLDFVQEAVPIVQDKNTAHIKVIKIKKEESFTI